MRRGQWMRGSGLLLALTVALAGCARGAPAAQPSPIEVLRQRAKDAPADASVQRALAEAELLWAEGDPSRAQGQIEHALELAPDDEVVLLLSALERNLHGDLERSLEQALSALERAQASESPEAPLVAEVATGALVDLRDGVPGYPEKVRDRLRPLVRAPGAIGPAAQARAGGILIDLAYRRGDVADAEALSRELGCVTDWRVAGPFGPRKLLGFDRLHPASDDGPLADTYDLGPGRGEQPTRDHGARGCTVQLGAPELGAGGTTYAQAFIEVDENRAGPHVLRLETPNAIQVYLGDERVVRLDARRFPTARVTHHSIDLPEGRHALTVKITTRHPRPAMDLALLPGSQAPSPGDDASDEGVLMRYLQAAAAQLRGDPVGAREMLRRLATDGDGSPVVLLLKAAVALSDGLRPADQRRDDARSWVAAAANRDPEAWLPQLQLARLASAEGEVVRAIDRLREAVDRWPGVPALPLSLHGLLLNRGWEAEAYDMAQVALARVPDGCPAIRTALSAARRRDRTKEARALVERLVECDARSDARLDDLTSQRKWDEAIEELERLAELEPPQRRHTVLQKRLKLARGRGDAEAVAKLLPELVEARRGNARHRRALADRAHAAGDTEQALDILGAAVDEDPSGMSSLHWPLRALGGRDVLEPFRVDGAQVLREFEASGRSYDAPQVLVWDYMAVRVFEDGSRMELIHQLYKVQSEEAVNAQGEFKAPDGARVLKLHTIKADGTRLEPEPIAGKDSISLPNLAVGDYVESEHVRFVDPPEALPGAVVGGRFYFRNFEVPFDRSELVVAVPQDRELTVDARGPAPETQTEQMGDLRLHRWEVTESRPLTPEPNAVAGREWVPSIGWGIDAKWELMTGGILDALADKDVVDPAARRLALRIVAGADDDRAKAEALYHWVLANVEDTNEVFGHAAPMLAARTGERHRVLRYLLSLVGVRSELVLARSIAGDQTRSSLADEDIYPNLLLMVEPRRRDPVFLSLADRGAPFGYVPNYVRGQEALVVAAGAPRVTVPEGEPNADAHTAELHVELGSNGAARVAAVETFVGAGAVAWRKNLEGVPAAVLEQRFDEGYVARLVPGARLSELQIEGRDDPEAPLVLRYVFDTPALGRRQGGTWVVPPLLPPNLTGRYASVGSRDSTQVAAPPLDQKLTVRMALPEGAEPVRLPPTAHVRGPGDAEVRTRSSHEGRTVELEREVRVPLMRVPPDVYPEWAAFCREADEATGRELPVTMPARPSE